jgi:hypothetical protein
MLRPAAGRVKIAAMADDFQFVRVRTVAGKTKWHVHRAGRFIGAIVEAGGKYYATGLLSDSVQGQQFADRVAAARWLAKLAGDG